ncbi:MAG: TetR/AcrR family transcriptional regulator [Phascolarctobacterium sp.]|nr:TetR/AcrR family transcriptional regulator [Phascolarctobacterium sp.]
MRSNGGVPKDQRILLAAEEVFSKSGYEKSTLDEIIALAAVGKGTVYKYFGSKEGLFYKLVNDKNIAFVERLKHAIAAHDNLEDKLLAYFAEMIKFYRTYPVLWQIICFEMVGPRHGCIVNINNGVEEIVPLYNNVITEENKKRVLRYHRILMSEYSVIHNLLKENVDKGVLKKDNVDFAAISLFFGVVMCVFNPIEYTRRQTNEEMASNIIDWFLHVSLVRAEISDK